MVDRYTKAVLTVIAGCLLWICALTVGRPALAQQLTRVDPVPAGVQPVVIVGWGTLDQNGKVALQMVTEGGVRRTDATLAVRADSPLPVTLPYTPEAPLSVRLGVQQGSPMPVSIKSVEKGSGPWDPIRADVESGPVRPRPGGER